MYILLVYLSTVINLFHNGKQIIIFYNLAVGSDFMTVMSQYTAYNLTVSLFTESHL